VESAGAVSGVKKLSMIDSAWGFDPAAEKYALSPYRSNYLLLGRYTNDINKAPYAPLFGAAGKAGDGLNSTEAEFQISFKGRFWASDDRRWGAWAAYTQQSQWQVYNGDLSRPFRETNYMPEAFVSYGPDADLGGGFRWKLLNAGFNHQSNGRTDVLSRSWNRFVANFGFERGDFNLVVKTWARIPEGESRDDNPDITSYLGYGEVWAGTVWRDYHLAVMFRNNLRFDENRSALQAEVSFPLIEHLNGYVQYFAGYGESLIDYNHFANRIGVGVMVKDW